MRLSPGAFNAHLAHMGQQFLYRKSFACPCTNSNSGAADPAHTLCRGMGRIWNPPVQGGAGVASSKTQREWAQFGVWESGDTVLSVPSDSPLYDIGQFDRAVALNNSDSFALVLTRGDNDELRIPTIKVTRVFWLDGAGAIVEGGIPTFDANGVLTWAAGEPPMGTKYSINGDKYVEYYCYGAFPGDRNQHSGALLPRRTVMRKFDLFGRT